MANKYLVGFLTLLVLVASVAIILPGQVRIDVGKTYSTFKVYEDNSWVLAGTERTQLMDRSAIMRAKSRTIESFIEENITTIIRTATFKNNITAIDTYTFDGSKKDVVLFPISHEIEIIGAKVAQSELGKNTEFILVYDVQDLLYTGETKSGITSPQEFGHKMKVEWAEGNYYSKIYKYLNKDEGKLTIKYRINSDDYKIDVRLFDPPIAGNDLTIANGETFTLGGNNDTYDTVWVQAGGILQINSTFGYLNLTANNITIDGTIDGNYKVSSGEGNGNAGVCDTSGYEHFGGGSGGGSYSTGGYGGSGCDSYACRAASGASYITETLSDINNLMGSKGGQGATCYGIYYSYGPGTGGAAIILSATDVKVSGTINSIGGTATQRTNSCNGDAKTGGSGGGSGGSIVLTSKNLDISNSVLSVKGGNGATGCYRSSDQSGQGGGGGSGGMILLFYKTEFSNTSTSITTSGGSGGPYSELGTNYPDNGGTGGTGLLLTEQIPLAVSNLTSEDSNFITANITGYCNGTVVSGENMTYYWNLYVDDVLNESGQTGNVTEQINVVNISSDLLAHNQTWSLECIVSDYTYNTTSDFELQVHQPIWINLTYPINGSSFSTSGVEINYSYENYTAYDSCWYTTDDGTTNNTVECNGTLGTLLFDDGEQTVKISSNNIYFDLIESNEDNNFDIVTQALSTPNEGGMIIQPKENILINEIIPTSGLSSKTSSKIYYTTNSSLISTSTTKNGDNFIFEDLPLNSGINYTITLDGSNVHYRDLSVSYPVENDYVYWIGGFWGSLQTGYALDISSINITYVNYTGMGESYETSDSVTFTVAAGNPDIEFVEPTPANDTWINTDYLYVRTLLGPCLTYKNSTFYLRSVNLDE